MTKHVLIIAITFGVFMNLFHTTDASTSPAPLPLTCPAGDLIRIIRRSFRKVIPEYNPNTITVEVKTDSKFRIKPSDPKWFNFLSSFQDLSDSIISSEEPVKLLKASMQTVLSYEFSNFLYTNGRPLSCISYYVGATEDYNPVLTVYKRAFKSHRYFSKRLFSQTDEEFSPVRGRDILQRLGTFFSRSPIPQKKSTDKVCSELIIEAKDGRILAKYPTVNLLPRYIRIPGEKLILDTFKHNATHSLQNYYDTALNCLDNEDLRSQYSSSLATWISDKLVPALLEARVCSRGFPRLLLFLASVDSYKKPQKLVRPPEEEKKMVAHSNNYELEQDYEPVQALSLPGQETSEETTKNGTSDSEAIAASASATVFLIFFACFLPLLFLVYHMYMKDQRSLGLRKWLSEKLVDNQKREQRQSRRKTRKRRSPPEEDKKPLIPQSSSDNNETPKKSFRSNSRDIYIQMAEYPMDISIEERDEESTNETSSPDDLIDEFNITKNKASKQKRQTTAGTHKSALGKNNNKPLKRSIFSHDDDDSDDEEELFSRKKEGKGSIYDFTSNGRHAKQQRRTTYRPGYVESMSSLLKGNKLGDSLKRTNSGKIVLPMSKQNNSLDSRKLERNKDGEKNKKHKGSFEFG